MTLQWLIPIADILEKYNIKFKSEIPERLKCIICKLILKNAKQTSCGCKVCEKCINNYLKDGEKPCPSNQHECAETNLKLSRDINQDNATNREIANLKAQCPFPSCTTVEPLRTIVTHIDSCMYREVICSIMHSWIEPEKPESECDNTFVICPHCQQSMTALIFNSTHLDEDNEDLCSKYVSDCSNKCGAKSVNRKSHIKSCTNKKVDCPFRKLDCNIDKLTTVKLTEHLQTLSHFNLLISIIDEQGRENKELSEDVKCLQIKVKEEMDKTIQLTGSQLKIEKTIEDLKKGAPSAAATVQENKVIFRKGSFIWKITEFETLKCNAENGGRQFVTSDSFYTSEFGYKICMRIYPAGHRIGGYVHVPVLFILMKGDFDDLLPWPFAESVTLTLLDQENDGIHNLTQNIIPDRHETCYKRPLDEYNIAAGSLAFIPMNSLFPSSAYYKNDTLFLKISVDTIGISRP